MIKEEEEGDVVRVLVGDRGLLAVLVKPCGLTTDLVQSLLSSQDLVFKNLLKIGVVNFNYTTHKIITLKSHLKQDRLFIM